jgi:hypothetical protein
MQTIQLQPDGTYRFRASVANFVLWHATHLEGHTYLVRSGPPGLELVFQSFSTLFSPRRMQKDLMQQAQLLRH